MKFNYELLKSISKKRNVSISKILKDSSVSRTAFYSLLKQESLIPKSVFRIANALGLPVEDLLLESPLKKTLRLQLKLQEILDTSHGLSRENAWHTLLLLEEPPIKRLDRALIRGRKSVYPKRS